VEDVDGTGGLGKVFGDTRHTHWHLKFHVDFNHRSFLKTLGARDERGRFITSEEIIGE
jgi:hypothetical protein